MRYVFIFCISNSGCEKQNCVIYLYLKQKLNGTKEVEAKHLGIKLLLISGGSAPYFPLTMNVLCSLSLELPCT